MNITRIEAKDNLKKRKVVAYCRVSTDQAEQLESYRTQILHYSVFIKSNHEWEFAGIYADSGKSGTSAARRSDFQRMINDAKARKFDLVIAKSISRFARNVVDAHKYARELRDYNVEIRFEREGISSFDPSADLIFNLLASIAQDESRSISENVKWRIRHDQERGIFHLGKGRILGYDEIDGKLVPNKDAWIVHKIFRLYCAGISTTKIVKLLLAERVKGQRSKGPISLSTVQGVLRNEIYMGDRILQKRAPVNFLTKRPDPMLSFNSYHITGDHEPIIDRETWERTKTIREKREKEAHNGVHCRETSNVFYGKLFCAICGAVFKRRTMKGKEGVYKAWNCAERQRGSKGNGCKNVIIREKILLNEIAHKLDIGIQLDPKTLAAHVTRVEISSDGINVEYG